MQIIKRAQNGGDMLLQFGTDLVMSEDGTFATLLGASPGASVAPSIVIDALERMFPVEFASSEWQERLQALVRSHGIVLHENPDQLTNAWSYTTEVLELQHPRELQRMTLRLKDARRAQVPPSHAERQFRRYRSR